MPRTLKAPKLPGIEVWVERIDAVTVAVHACRRWDGEPRLAAWSILHHPEGSGQAWRFRVPGEYVLETIEAKVHVRWLRHAQRSLQRSAELYRETSGTFDIQAHWAVRDWNGIPQTLTGES